MARYKQGHDNCNLIEEKHNNVHSSTWLWLHEITPFDSKFYSEKRLQKVEIPTLVACQEPTVGNKRSDLQWISVLVAIACWLTSTRTLLGCQMNSDIRSPVGPDPEHDSPAASKNRWVSWQITTESGLIHEIWTKTHSFRILYLCEILHLSQYKILWFQYHKGIWFNFNFQHVLQHEWYTYKGYWMAQY